MSSIVIINEEDIIYEEDLNMKQYLMGEPSGQNLTICNYLGNITVNKKDRTYHRLKICEFASPKLQEIEYKSVDLDSDLRLKVNEKLSSNNIENNTFA
ncbi:1779_t:CDS:2 [Funneliformis mosseae]|uniref:1779_t:CDS:1 n=1 Tax=Funneliformis mosseae TaxID=27381 RepID=A0A9N9GYY4_FUNMO|nr:1779_t:CDS:2 [Funneliformis mosseae]